MDKSRRFGGLSRLYGQEALERFSRAHVCVVGIGGVGSWSVEALARSGIGVLTLIDLDHIAESNVNRQIHALEPTLGQAKVQAMAARVKEINPQARVETVEDFAEPGNLDNLFGAEFDFVLDCIDGYRNKSALIAHCRRHRIPQVSVGGAGGIMDPTRVRIADLSRTEQDPLLAKTRKLLRTDYGFPSNPKRRFGVPCVYSDEHRIKSDQLADDCSVDAGKPAGSGLNCGGYGSVVTVTASFGLAAAAHALKKLGNTQDKS